MNKIELSPFIIHHDTKETLQCPIKLSETLYIEDTPLPDCWLGEATIAAPQYYHADCPQLKHTDYLLSEPFKQILQRFPHTNTTMVHFGEDGIYQFQDIPMYITTTDYLLGLLQPDEYPMLAAQLKAFSTLSPVFLGAQDEPLSPSPKRKRLFTDGTYGKREWVAGLPRKEAQPIQNQLAYVQQMYYFMHYRYAAMIEFLPEYNIRSYEAFHEAYGKYVYSFTIRTGEQTVPLLWPDYLYHRPENHLEFGVLAHQESPRYRLFDNWQEGQEVTVEILAEGFEDVRFTTTLKKMLAAPPILSSQTYDRDDTLELTAEEPLLEELKGEAIVQICGPKQLILDKQSLDFQFTEQGLTIPCRQFIRSGRYQLRITSPRYGHMLFLFSVTKEKDE